MNALFVADSFGKSFGRNTVLKSATAWATPGRVTVLMGRNGSGKSTLIRSALGIHRAAYGVVRFDGATFTRPRLWRLARLGLFYLPDRGLLSRRMPFRDQARLLESRFPEADVESAADQMGIGDLMHAFPDEMSGGERRRAELALALGRKPRCIIADEPLAEIEPKDRSRVGGALREAARRGVAVLITGHEVVELMGVADEVVWMVAGTTHSLGSPERAQRHDQFRREYLGPGYRA